MNTISTMLKPLRTALEAVEALGLADDEYTVGLRAAIAAGEQELKREPVAWLDTNRWDFVSGARSPVARFPSGNWVPLYTPTIGETK